MIPICAVVCLSVGAAPYPYTGEPATCLADLYRFPDFDCGPHLDHIMHRAAYYREQAALYPWDADLRATHDGWRHRNCAWSCLEKARFCHRYGQPEEVLHHLRQLRLELGRKAWYEGKMP